MSFSKWRPNVGSCIASIVSAACNVARICFSLRTCSALTPLAPSSSKSRLSPLCLQFLIIVLRTLGQTYVKYDFTSQKLFYTPADFNTTGP
jgi:hypothetical protein